MELPVEFRPDRIEGKQPGSGSIKGVLTPCTCTCSTNRIWQEITFILSNKVKTFQILFVFCWNEQIYVWLTCDLQLAVGVFCQLSEAYQTFLKC